jgi:arsenate reductase-like glutaredoxin family protein
MGVGTMSKIYGITTCDTMKTALAWRNECAVTYEFHEDKKRGVPRERLVGFDPAIFSSFVN